MSFYPKTGIQVLSECLYASVEQHGGSDIEIRKLA